MDRPRLSPHSVSDVVHRYKVTAEKDDMGLDFFLENVHEIAPLLNTLYADGLFSQGPHDTLHVPCHTLPHLGIFSRPAKRQDAPQDLAPRHSE